MQANRNLVAFVNDSYIFVNIVFFILLQLRKSAISQMSIRKHNISKHVKLNYLKQYFFMCNFEQKSVA